MSKKEIKEHVKNAGEHAKNAGDELRIAGDLAAADAREGVESARRQLTIVARETGDRVQDYLNHKRDQALQAKQRAEANIQAHPLASTGIAVLIGMVLGSLLTRRA